MNNRKPIIKFNKSGSGNRPSIVYIVIIVLVYIGFVIGITILAINRSAELTKLEIEDHLLTILETTNASLDIWLEQQQEHVFGQTLEQEVIDATIQLLDSPRNQEDLLDHPIQNDLREYFQPILENYGDLGIFIIAPDYISLASMRDANVGTINLIAENRPDLLERVFRGETLLIPPIFSDVPLPDSSGNSLRSNLPTMFVASPIRDEDDQIIAILTLRIDPSTDFSRIISLGRLVNTGETYAFDAYGFMMSDCRFPDDLVNIGLLEEGDRSINKIRIVDPGGNMVEGFQPISPWDDLPFTTMVSSALEGNQGSNMDGYRDYRGVTVFGTWRWNDELGVGLATEIDRDEAMEPYLRTRSSILLLVSVTMIVSLSLAGGLFYLRWRHTHDLEIAYLALQNKELQLSEILNNANDAIISINKKGEITTFNHAAEGLFGYQANEVLGKNINILMPDPDHSQHDTYLNNYYQTGIRKVIGKGVEVTGSHKDGSKLSLHIGISESKIGEEHVYTSVIRDIALQREVEQAIKEARDSAEAASMAKTEFISNVSHELRTPLNSLMGATYQAEKMTLSAPQMELLSKIKLAASSLSAITDTILDFTDIRDGEFDIVNTPFDPRDLLSSLSNKYSVKAREKNLKASFQIDSEIPGLLIGDPERIEQVLDLLVDNAIKFTTDGEIIVSLDLAQTHANNATLQFNIHDTGIGMTEDEILQIFQPFTQIDGSSTRRFSGLGMGLVLSKQIIERMGGEIHVESRPGEGSTFYFLIDLKIGPKDLSGEKTEVIVIPESKTMETAIHSDNPQDLDLELLFPLFQELAYHLKEHNTLAKSIMPDMKHKILTPGLQENLKEIERQINLYSFEDALMRLTQLADEIGITLER